MSDATMLAPTERSMPRPSGRRGTPRAGLVARLAVLLAGLVAPFYLEVFWLQVGVFAFAAMVAALGLNLLVGEAGQLSLAHSFFIAVGAYGYTLFASPSQPAGGGDQVGWGLPPIVAVALAVIAAGVAGLLFSPIAARLRGIYLGVASLGLVFLGQHVLVNAESITGGFNGRDVPPLTVFGFSFDDVPGETLHVLGVPFTRMEKLWYVGLAAVVLAWLFYRNVRSSRAGRALHAVRDGEVAASVMGVHVTRFKGAAFLASSMLAGLGGVLLALAFRHIVPETFGVLLAIEYLAMIVIGGVGSPGGTLAGALFVSSLPVVLERYSDVLPFVTDSPTGGGVTAGVAARFCYGAAIVALLLAEPGGLAALGRRARRWLARRSREPALGPVPSPAAAALGDNVATATPRP
ncbi:MAG TPA: branched-chain amino acid ABC transporter permease [Acidimicrobiales bacterium]|nr:branched-chain amino acid ABC transporter permease [Acidimicrobiales bacterium]